MNYKADGVYQGWFLKRNREGHGTMEWPRQMDGRQGQHRQGDLAQRRLVGIYLERNRFRHLGGQRPDGERPGTLARLAQ